MYIVEPQLSFGERLYISLEFLRFSFDMQLMYIGTDFKVTPFEVLKQQKNT
jgi:hypothetical protein